MKFMISQPMGGLSDEEILETKRRVTDLLEREGHTVINTFIQSDPPIRCWNRGLWFLGMSLVEMSECDGMYFCKGWENAKGCRMEHEAAIAYGLPCRYEN